MYNQYTTVSTSTSKFFKHNKIALVSCYIFVFSRSDVRDFFMYIITRRQREKFRIKLPTNTHLPGKQQQDRQMRGLQTCQAPKCLKRTRLRLVFPLHFFCAAAASSCFSLLYNKSKLRGFFICKRHSFDIERGRFTLEIIVI